MTGWWLGHPSEKYESIGMISNPIYGKIKNGNQTTNQSKDVKTNSKKIYQRVYRQKSNITIIQMGDRLSHQNSCGTETVVVETSYYCPSNLLVPSKSSNINNCQYDFKVLKTSFLPWSPTSGHLKSHGFYHPRWSDREFCHRRRHPGLRIGPHEACAPLGTLKAAPAPQAG